MAHILRYVVPIFMQMKHSKEYRLIGQKLIRTLEEFSDIQASGVKIAYLSSDEEKTKNHKIVFGECHKVPKNMKWCCKYDFYIVIYDMNIINFNNKQLETLIRHELHHVGIDFDGYETTYYLEPHDKEEFDVIIAECGLDWSDVNA